MKPVAIVLSGCGVNDGAEITEAVGLVIALSQAGLPYAFFAPDRPQWHVIDHARGSISDEQRNILSEAARIARGKIQPLSALDEREHSALAFPGGFGAAKNLCNFARDGSNAVLAEDVKAAATAFFQAGKPLLALCAAPLVLGLLARDMGLTGVSITFGSETEGKVLADALRSWGQQHVVTAVDQACVDEARRFISAPAYMYDAATPAQVFASCQAAVAALQTLSGQAV